MALVILGLVFLTSSVDRRFSHQSRALQSSDAPQPSEPACRIEVTARYRDGREFPAQLIISAIQLGTQITYAAFFHDLTERKLVGREREEAKAAAEARA